MAELSRYTTRLLDWMTYGGLHYSSRLSIELSQSSLPPNPLTERQSEQTAQLRENPDNGQKLLRAYIATRRQGVAVFPPSMAEILA
jgi:hypothetical protein